MPFIHVDASCNTKGANDCRQDRVDYDHVVSSLGLDLQLLGILVEDWSLRDGGIGAVCLVALLFEVARCCFVAISGIGGAIGSVGYRLGSIFGRLSLILCSILRFLRLTCVLSLILLRGLSQILGLIRLTWLGIIRCWLCCIRLIRWYSRIIRNSLVSLRLIGR